ncbi:MAG: hypothetical protein ACO1RA_20135 [Planctomycetaceae bacterium]
MARSNRLRFAVRAILFGSAAVLGASLDSAQVQAQGRSRFSGDPTEFLKRMDANGNGQIDPGEASGRMLSSIQRAATAAGLDPNQPLPIDKLGPAMAQQMQERSDRRGDGPPEGSSGGPPGQPPGSPPGTPGSTPPGSPPLGSPPGTPPGSPPGTPAPSSTPSPMPTTPSGPPKVPGFGVAQNLAPVAGFDGKPVSGTKRLEDRFDPRVIDYVDNQILAKFDTNKDTYLDSEEWKANTWSTPPESSDTDKDKRLSREELCVRVAARFGVAPPGGSGGSDRDKGRDSRKEGKDGNNEQFKKFAESLIKQHDKNKDGFLDREESKELKTEHRSADANGDGMITLDELTVKLASYTPGSNSGSASSSKSSASAQAAAPKRAWWKNAPSGSSDKSVERRGVRALTPTERLPKGLPEWFARSDVDGDGQVMMSEYAASWSESKVAEFQKYDLDGDGLITPEECMAIDGAKKPPR